MRWHVAALPGAPMDTLLRSCKESSKNGFQYIMNDVNEWPTEYHIQVDKIVNWQNSPH